MSKRKLSIGQTTTTQKGEEVLLQLMPNYMALALGNEGDETPEFILQVNGEVENPHPLTVAIKLLFGDNLPPDILDYFGEVKSSKKSLHKDPLKFSEVLELIQHSITISPEICDWKIDNKLWKTLKGNPEGSAFTTQEIGEIATLTKEHYALVSVPTGFYYYSTLVNLFDIVEFLGWEEYLPEEVWESWWISAAISIWVIYEGLGLGGLNKAALKFHSYVSEYSRRGFIEFPEEEDAVAYEGESYDILVGCWTELLKSEGIQPSVYENLVILDTVIWLAHLRAIGQKVSKDKELSQYQNDYTFGQLGIGEHLLLASIATVMRDSAKGRMNLEVEDESEMAGCLKYISSQEDFVDSLADALPKDCSLGVLMLKDMVEYQKHITRLRLAEID